MNPHARITFADTAELRALAERVVWFKTPRDALADPLHLIAHVLTYGTQSDVAVLRRYVDDHTLSGVMDVLPPGVLDARSWAYWRLILGMDPDVGLPRRMVG